MKPHKKNKRGFTLIEAVMVISIAGLIAFLVGNFVITSIQAWLLVSVRSSAANSARVAMNRMTAEIKSVNRPQSLFIIQPSECQFLDINNDTIDFRQSGSDLMRDNDILATGLTSPEGIRFIYLDVDGLPTDSILDIRSIRIWLSLSLGDQRITLESAARIRNL